jgi:fused signal recognition particle receptor
VSTDPTTTPATPEIQPRAPQPEMPPPSPAAPDIQPGFGAPDEAPQPADPDVGTPPPEQAPPSPSPIPGGVPVMGVLVLLAGLTLGGAAWAQAEQSPLPETTPPEVEDGRPVGAAEGGSLSDELSRSGGVIAPPDASTTDPGIVRPAPDKGRATMRVIPPPE